ncbi:MAG: polyamine aminopropyltransferase [Elusimicrobiota bacterium]|jgi:spermidine synthase
MDFSSSSGSFITSSKIKRSSEWFTERFSPHESHSHRFKQTLVKTRTRFQNALLGDSYSFGRCLILDGEMQSAQLDEFIYHECLVQPAMVLHRDPKEVLILGGGEGATVREILRHRGVKRVTMVDIDGEVVDFCKRYLKEWHQGTLVHPKTRLIIGDAREFVLQTHEKFDIIISDLPTPIEGGPAYQLYTVEFYKKMIQRMAPGGIFVAQAGSGSMIQIHFHSVLFNTLRKIFKVVRPFYAFVPSFDVPWAYLLCTQKADPKTLSPKRIDRNVRAFRKDLRFYDGEAHQGLFNIPKYLRQSLSREKQIITEKKPVFFFK